MSIAYKIGLQAHDSLTGKKLIVVTRARATLVAATGYAMQINAADYIVTAGKTFYPCGVYYTHDATAFGVGASVIFRYADNAALTTNPVTMDATAPVFQAVAAAEPTCYPLSNVAVPATKYFGVYNPGGVNTDMQYGVIVVGYEA